MMPLRTRVIYGSCLALLAFTSLHAASAPIGDARISAQGRTHIVAETAEGRIDAVILTRLATPAEAGSSGVTRCSGGRTTCSLVDSLRITIGRNAVLVPERATILLADVNRGRVARIAPGRYALNLTCGDAAAAYDARLYFTRTMVTRMDIWATEAGRIEQSTRYEDVSKAFS